MVMMRLGVVVPLLLIAGCAGSPPAAPSAAAGAGSPPAVPSAVATALAPAVSDCGSITLRQGERMPEAPVTCFLDAHHAKRAARLERTAPSVEGHPVREEYVADDTGSIAVTFDMSKDPYGGYRIERQVCSEVRATEAGFLAVAGCKIR
jgi:hypothetical protein